jgi:hypothetical protein
MMFSFHHQLLAYYVMLRSGMVCPTQHSLRELKVEQKRRAFFCAQTTAMDSSNSEKYDEIRYAIMCLE